jgi:SAM-dependent methyltransferase
MNGPMGCPCDGVAMEEAWTYSEPPEGETVFPALAGVPYSRHVRRCRICDHYVSEHAMDLGDLYGGGYVDATYGGAGQRAVFERIIALPPERSDNHGRVRRVVDYADAFLTVARTENRRPTALDVGSGLCVFLHRLAAEGFDCLALDPDPRAAEHAREVAGVAAVAGDFMQAEDLGRFDVVTLNKVLEHVADPVAMLARTVRFLNPGGFVYVEVPDGPEAALEGAGREEFFIEHLHIFSPASLSMLVDRAGLTLERLDRMREPSTKYTLVAFCRAPEGFVG